MSTRAPVNQKSNFQLFCFFFVLVHFGGEEWWIDFVRGRFLFSFSKCVLACVTLFHAWCLLSSQTHSDLCCFSIPRSVFFVDRPAITLRGQKTNGSGGWGGLFYSNTYENFSFFFGVIFVSAHVSAKQLLYKRIWRQERREFLKKKKILLFLQPERCFQVKLESRVVIKRSASPRREKMYSRVHPRPYRKHRSYSLRQWR